MNEAYCTGMIMRKMRERGYLVRKIAGTLHSPNMPDFYACRSHVTVFFESKLFKVSSLAKLERIPMKITPQMISLGEHEHKAVARYLIFVNDGTVTWINDFEPHIIQGLISGNGLISPTDLFMEVNKWLETRLGKLFQGNETR